jgi:hypothetical protein
MKLYERYIKFVKNVTTTISDEQMTKIEVVHLQKLHNFVVEQFLIRIIFVNEKYIWNFSNLKFWIFKRPQMVKHSK